eukprot:TRINITY_DN1271_c2_g1_i1.p1 TRINITY_DN1271_c2_g1~~TRINITY_DN1271_c2_g1_i1.p1  ORF type:complete len:656 (+),score=120.27 TRINITY_DN1271_c2_g1_i1:195-2162(+)
MSGRAHASPCARAAAPSSRARDMGESLTGPRLLESREKSRSKWRDAYFSYLSAINYGIGTRGWSGPEYAVFRLPSAPTPHGAAHMRNMAIAQLTGRHHYQVKPVEIPACDPFTDEELKVMATKVQTAVDNFCTRYGHAPPPAGESGTFCAGTAASFAGGTAVAAVAPEAVVAVAAAAPNAATLAMETAVAQDAAMVALPAATASRACELAVGTASTPAASATSAAPGTVFNAAEADSAAFASQTGAVAARSADPSAAAAVSVQSSLTVCHGAAAPSCAATPLQAPPTCTAVVVPASVTKVNTSMSSGAARAEQAAPELLVSTATVAPTALTPAITLPLSYSAKESGLSTAVAPAAHHVDPLEPAAPCAPAATIVMATSGGRRPSKRQAVATNSTGAALASSAPAKKPRRPGASRRRKAQPVALITQGGAAAGPNAAGIDTGPPSSTRTYRRHGPARLSKWCALRPGDEAPAVAAGAQQEAPSALQPFHAPKCAAAAAAEKAISDMPRARGELKCLRHAPKAAVTDATASGTSNIAHLPAVAAFESVFEAEDALMESVAQAAPPHSAAAQRSAKSQEMLHTDTVSLPPMSAPGEHPQQLQQQQQQHLQSLHARAVRAQARTDNAARAASFAQTLTDAPPELIASLMQYIETQLADV